MTDRFYARAVLGAIVPNRGDIEDIPEPYRTTVRQSRALMKLKGSKPVEPGEAQKALISEKPTK